MTSRRMTAVRLSLVAIGLAGLALGAQQLLATQRGDQVVGVGLWIGAAILLHDAILSPLVFAVSLVLRRLGRRIGWADLGIVQGAVVVGSVLTLLVVPELYAQARGTRNASVLPLDYGLHLAALWAGLAVVTAAVLLARRLGRRTQTR